ncbi:hypothetical protein [Streptomyces sp. NRRL S-37]|uniref:hypothetical protein n=1 Tax=Streptomyces sp. NRRL S-37 TaxID=1463903 RepID=UPI001F3CCAF0|nr:hypothetical protein [Streptomyces sp. NRRL S-37]
MAREIVVLMVESWVIDDGSTTPVPSGAVSAMLRARCDRGQFETWLTSSSGRSLTFVTNTERAMVMLLDGEGDPGEHAVDPGAEGLSHGFILSDGQHDAYPDRDTVPIDEALRLVEHIVGTGSWPAAARRVVDR